MAKKRISKIGISRTLIGSTLMLILMLQIVSLSFPGSFITLFAETSTVYVLLRSGIVLLLIGLLLTYAPRSTIFRLALGVWSLALGASSLQLLLSYQLNILDAVVFAEVAVIFAIEALETRSIPIRKPHSPSRRVTVRTA